MPEGVSSVVTSLTLGLCTILVPSKSTLLGAVAGGGGGGAVFASTLTFFAGLFDDSDLTVDDFLRSRLTGLSNGGSSFKSLPS